MEWVTKMVSEAAFLDLSEEAIPVVSDHILTHLCSGLEKGGLYQLENALLVQSWLMSTLFVLFLHIS